MIRDRNIQTKFLYYLNFSEEDDLGINVSDDSYSINYSFEVFKASSNIHMLAIELIFTSFSSIVRLMISKTLLTVEVVSIINYPEVLSKSVMRL